MLLKARREKKSRDNNDVDMLLVRCDKMNTEKNDTIMLLRVKRYKKSRGKNDAELLQ